MPIEHRDKHTFCPAKISCARIGRRDLASNQLQNELAIGSLYNVRPNISYGQQPIFFFLKGRQQPNIAWLRLAQSKHARAT